MISKKVHNELGEEIFLQVLNIFLENIKRDFMLLNLYTESKDYSNSKEICHKLIGSCVSVGVKKLPTVLRKLDKDLIKRYYNPYDLSEINKMYEELISYIKKEYKIKIEA